MMAKFLKRLVGACLLLALQVLLLNKIHILGCATPYFFIYFILRLDTGTSQASRMLWAFMLGLTVDVFSNTVGMHAASATLLAYAQPVLLRKVFAYDRRDRIKPCVASVGMRPFLLYAVCGTLLHHTVFCLLRVFSFDGVWMLVQMILLSSLMTVALMIVSELLLGRNSRRRR